MILQAVLSNRRFTFNDQQFEQGKGLAMRNRLSGILATLVKDDLERITITADLSICLFARYVDDIFIITKDKAAADKLFNEFKQQHSDIKHPSSNNELSLLDFKDMFADHKATFNCYQKDVKKNMFPHFRSAVPRSKKTAYVTNEYQRMTYKCSTQSEKRKCHMNFLTKTL